MPTFAQWLAGKQRRVVYVSGNEAVLREHVVVKRQASAEPENKVSITATGENDADIWDELNQHPLIARKAIPTPPGEKPRFAWVHRHVTIREAHRMKDFGPLEFWLAEMDDVWATFESPTEVTVPLFPWQQACFRGHQCAKPEQVKVTTVYGKERRECVRCLSAKNLLNKSTKASVVTCNSPNTKAQQEAAVKLMMKITRATEAKCRNLLWSTRWQVGAAIEVAQKLALLNSPLTDKNISLALLSNEDTAFETALRKGQRRKAAEVAANVPESEVQRIFERMDQWLGAVTLAGQLARTGASAMQIRDRCGVSYGLALKLVADAGQYNKANTERALNALAAASADWTAGRRVGVLEVLAHRW